jgi:hypothetical protein
MVSAVDATIDGLTAAIETIKQKLSDVFVR